MMHFLFSPGLLPLAPSGEKGQESSRAPALTAPHRAQHSKVTRCSPSPLGTLGAAGSSRAESEQQNTQQGLQSLLLICKFRLYLQQSASRGESWQPSNHHSGSSQDNPSWAHQQELLSVSEPAVKCEVVWIYQGSPRPGAGEAGIIKSPVGMALLHVQLHNQLLVKANSKEII